MRVFIAVEFKDEVKQYLKRVQDIVKTTTYSGNFTNYDNFHLTVKYIGEILNGEYEELCHCIDDVAKNTKPFTIKIGDIGFFSKKTSNIVWVGITTGKEELMKLHKLTDRETNLSGFASEHRRFKPHVTIGKKVVFSTGSYSSGLPYFSEAISVSKLTLFESSRVNGILTYTPLYTKELGGNNYANGFRQ